MVTAKVIVTQAIPMQVPPASTPTAVQLTLVVTIAADGAPTLDGAPMPNPGALGRGVKARTSADTVDPHAVIAASSSASHGVVIGAIDALRSAGVMKIAFAVERKN